MHCIADLVSVNFILFNLYVYGTIFNFILVLQSACSEISFCSLRRMCRLVLRTVYVMYTIGVNINDCLQFQ
jgi:hypothetical protein